MTETISILLAGSLSLLAVSFLVWGLNMEYYKAHKHEELNLVKPKFFGFWFSK